MESDRSVICFAGVRFMAETAKILNPGRTVLLPDPKAGCGLSDSITAEQVRAWKAEHPGAAVIAYINTSAEVKAEADSFTSAICRARSTARLIARPYFTAASMHA